MPELRDTKKKKPQALVVGNNPIRTRAVTKAAAVAAEKKKICAEVPVIFVSDKGGSESAGRGGEKVKMAGEDSGGLSANKAAGQEEKGNTAPFLKGSAAKK